MSNKYDFLNDYTDNFFEARKRLLHDDPFYALMVAQMSVEMDKKVKTISIKEKDGVVYLVYSQEWVDSLEVDQVVEAIKHVINHLIYNHLNNWVFDDKDPRMETAKDLAVNTGLCQKNLPPDFKKPVDFNLPEDQATFQYYNLLPKEEDQGEGESPGGKPGQSDGNNQEENGRGGCDNHDYMTSTVSESQLQQQTKQMVQQAYNKCGNNCGNNFSPTGSGFQKMLRFLLTPSEIPWNIVLKRFVAFASKVKREQTWKRPNRRLGDEYQGRKKVQTLKIMVQVDESGSVSDSEWKQMLAETDSIYKTKMAEIVFVKFTTTIESMFEYTGVSNAVFKRHSGGTAFQPGLDLAMGKKVNNFIIDEKPDALIILTDGENREGDQLKYDKWQSVLWVLTPQHRTPNKGSSVVIKNLQNTNETVYW